MDKKKTRKLYTIKPTPILDRDIAYLQHDTGDSISTIVRTAVRQMAEKRRLLNARLAMEEAGTAYVNQDGER